MRNEVVVKKKENGKAEGKGIERMTFLHATIIRGFKVDLRNVNRIRH